MDFSNQSDRISRYAVALQGAVRKTINVKLNTNAQKPITAIQVDNQKNLIDKRTVQPQHLGEDFDFTDDGELFFIEGTEVPSLENVFLGASTDNGLNMNMEISEFDGGSTRDVTTNQKPQPQPGEA